MALMGQNPSIRALEHGAAFTGLGPGEWRIGVESGWALMAARPGAEVGFTDAAGRSWIRRANGELERIRTNAIDHYRIPRPVDFTAPTEA